MKKVFALGTGPLLEPGVKEIGGHCLRTWHFTKPLLDQGFEVNLYTVPLPKKVDDYEASGRTALLEEKQYSGFNYKAFLTNDVHKLIPVLEKDIEEYKPDLMLGINTYPSYLLSRVKSFSPLWVDLNGYHLAEGAVHAYRHKSDDFLKNFWEQELAVVQRADKFSAVSERQRLALLGEIALCGRLNYHTFSHDFAVTVPNAVNEMYLGKAEMGKERELRGKLVPEDAFIVLWSGGYNCWTDVSLLYQGLMHAMERHDKIYFVSTGGGLEGHDEKTYREFTVLINTSSKKGRFHLLGWIEAEKLPVIYREADIGLNIDSWNYETLFGARNRLVNMMACGLCVCTTEGTEISQIIKEAGAGFTFPIGDIRKFAELIIQCAGDRGKVREKGQQGKKYALDNFSYVMTTKPFLT